MDLRNRQGIDRSLMLPLFIEIDVELAEVVRDIIDDAGIVGEMHHPDPSVFSLLHSEEGDIFQAQFEIAGRVFEVRNC